MRQVHTYANNLSVWQRDRRLPVTAVPAAPVAVTPAPMTVTPTPVAMTPTPVTVVPVMAPTHLFRLEAAHFVFGRDGGNGIFVRRRQPFIFRKRLRRKRRGLRARSQRGGAGGNSKGKFQEVAAFHDISPFGFG